MALLIPMSSFLCDTISLKLTQKFILKSVGYRCKQYMCSFRKFYCLKFRPESFIVTNIVYSNEISGNCIKGLLCDVLCTYIRTSDQFVWKEIC